jgi:predicted transcriptional regulator
MALQDFLGDKKEIEIFDFLAENIGNSYNQSELSELIGISRMTLNKYLPKLIQNNLVEIDQSVGSLKTYKIADNNFVKMLIGAVMEHSFMQSEKPIGRDEELDKIQKEIGSGFVYVKNRYYKPTEYSCYTYEVVSGIN